MKSKIPKIKKKVNSFLLGEEGKISKKTLYKTGMVLSAIAISAEMAIKNAEAHDSHGNHSNSYNPDCSGCTAPNGGTCHESSVNLELDELKVQAISTHDNCLENHGNSHSSHDQHQSCCVPAGTLVLLPDNKRVKIEEVKKDATIISYNLETQKAEPAVVTDLHTPLRTEIYKINGDEIMVTDDHPFWIQKKNKDYTGWAAINPEHARDTYPQLNIELIEKGDKMFHIERGWVELSEVDLIKGDIKTYSLANLTKNGNFFVNGFLTHNHGGPCGW